jgi:hypothetical protein
MTKPLFTTLIGCFLAFCTPSVFGQKLVKLGYSFGNFDQKFYQSDTKLNAQGFQFSYEKASRLRDWSWGLTLDFSHVQRYFPVTNGIIPEPLNLLTIEPDWKYYFQEKTNNFYVGLGLPISISYDVFGGLSAKIGYQKWLNSHFAVHIGGFYGLQMPIDDPGPVKRLGGLLQLAYILPYSETSQKEREMQRIEQKMAFRPVSIFKIGGGVHMLYVDGPVGGGIYASLEKTLSPHWSINYNLELIGNGQECCTDEEMRNINQFRLIVQPDFRYYPNEVLRGFYIGSGLGMIGGYGKVDNVFINGKRNFKAFAELVLDVKMGVQFKVSPKNRCNAFFNLGLAADPIFGELAPFARSGLQVSLQR